MAGVAMRRVGAPATQALRLRLPPWIGARAKRASEQAFPTSSTLVQQTRTTGRKSRACVLCSAATCVDVCAPGPDGSQRGGNTHPSITQPAIKHPASQPASSSTAPFALECVHWPASPRKRAHRRRLSLVSALMLSLRRRAWCTLLTPPRAKSSLPSKRQRDQGRPGVPFVSLWTGVCVCCVSSPAQQVRQTAPGG